jgi:hypothetical protein
VTAICWCRQDGYLFASKKALANPGGVILRKSACVLHCDFKADGKSDNLLELLIFVTLNSSTVSTTDFFIGFLNQPHIPVILVQ